MFNSIIIKVDYLQKSIHLD